jgi:hypothetical protein
VQALAARATRAPPRAPAALSAAWRTACRGPQSPRWPCARTGRSQRPPPQPTRTAPQQRRRRQRTCPAAAAAGTGGRLVAAPTATSARPRAAPCPPPRAPQERGPASRPAHCPPATRADSTGPTHREDAGRAVLSTWRSAQTGWAAVPRAPARAARPRRVRRALRAALPLQAALLRGGIPEAGRAGARLLAARAPLRRCPSRSQPGSPSRRELLAYKHPLAGPPASISLV